MRDLLDLLQELVPFQLFAPDSSQAPAVSLSVKQADAQPVRSVLSVRARFGQAAGWKEAWLLEELSWNGTSVTSKAAPTNYKGRIPGAA
jgi:hypothetical protein